MPPLDAFAALEPSAPVRGDLADLNARYARLSAEDVIALSVEQLFRGKVASVSSFGSESAVLLHILSRVDPTVPVLFLDTGRLFAETLAYRTELVARLGLRDVRTITPDPERLAALDPVKALWMTNPDLCCRIRKTEPLARAVKGFDAWFTGRKRFQSSTRAGLSTFEAEGGQVKINPLADWTAADLITYAEEHDLPPHPLVARGYPSIGCVPCTDRVLPGEDPRAGRWRGTGKIECGIHLGLEADGSGI
ncbi:MAG: phosphoadenylyl-sulfate reductase [Bauldia sp.]|nr:phosphoadenylyl-sulfate reductase [Bauldia sp.]MCW5718537.1 phosphoadenylyl-sulfate reductase [Bauldia sp.]